MKVLVLFGSSSDEYVYNPLIENLGEISNVSFAVISAHRNPVELEKRLSQKDYDVIVAGAGIAAHLPGVVASQVNVPVFGVPVEAVYGGMDALLSIQQMPFGVPVLTCPPTQSKNIVEFLKEAQSKEKEFFKNIHLVVPAHVKDYEYTTKELARTYDYANAQGLDITQSSTPVENRFNIYLVTQQSEVCKDALAINVPLLDKLVRDNPYKVTELFDWVKEGGLWVGTNNTRNALVFAQKLANGSF